MKIGLESNLNQSDYSSLQNAPLALCIKNVPTLTHVNVSILSEIHFSLLQRGLIQAYHMMLL